MKRNVAFALTITKANPHIRSMNIGQKCRGKNRGRKIAAQIKDELSYNLECPGKLNHKSLGLHQLQKQVMKNSRIRMNYLNGEICIKTRKATFEMVGLTFSITAKMCKEFSTICRQNLKKSAKWPNNWHYNFHSEFIFLALGHRVTRNHTQAKKSKSVITTNPKSLTKGGQIWLTSGDLKSEKRTVGTNYHH